MPEQDLPNANPDIASKTSRLQAAETYEHGLALRNAGLFKQAIDQSKTAADNPAFATKAYAHIGLSCKSCDRYEDVVTAFRHALQSPGVSAKETLPILYVLGSTLESLGCISEALEPYRWLRRENSRVRDAGGRSTALRTGRVRAELHATLQSKSFEESLESPRLAQLSSNRQIIRS